MAIAPVALLGLVMLNCRASTELDGGGAATAAGSGGDTSTSSSTVGGFAPGAGGAGGAPCGPSCSTDLKSVLDCFGAPIEECGPDEACLNGACTDDPCAAAAAAESSIGCEFWAVKPEPHGGGGCFAVVLANTWDVALHVSVSRFGTVFGDTSFIRVPQGEGLSVSYEPYDPTVGVPPGGVAVAFLSHSPQASYAHCPVPPAVEAEVAVHGTNRGDAFSIQTDRPVAAYSVNPYGSADTGHTSASLLLPASSWHSDYLAISPFETSQLNGSFKPSLVILAREPDTEVTIVPKVMIGSGVGVDYAPPGQPTTYTLDAGQYLQVSQYQELTGSPIQASKPIGVWGTSNCIHVPATFGACDSAHQQLPPIRALGSRYVGIRYRNRAAASGEEAPPWRLVGAVDGTQLSWTPAVPEGAPTTLDLGEVAEFYAPGYFVVESQSKDHPFYLAQYMTSATYVNPDETIGEGDPEWVNVVPTEQYLDRYVFFTDPTYPETSLVVVRKRSAQTQQFADVTLACAGKLTGWKSVGDFQYARIDLVTGDFEGVNGCDNGRQELTSTAPFGVTVWGWGGYGLLDGEAGTSWNSYGFPAGASLRSVNDVSVTLPPR